ncbi:DUF58 domain-containing protein [Nonomuraea sp. NPDC000554]|uniref:DUF58 domain-containing protein n=1 Tax=Nonomuraea sp. NPDC000554 TaxID=3154259 RepID=UPI00332878F9
MITKAGWGTLAASALLYAAGAPLGYQQAATLSAAGVAAVGASLLWTLRRPRLRVRRDLAPAKVARGEPAIAMLHVTNTGRRRRDGLRALDACRDTAIAVDLPSLATGASKTVSYRLPTRRRGETPVGPLRLDRADPFGLARRTTSYGQPDTLLVRPRTVALGPLNSGRQRHLDGLASRSAPSGTITFNGVRDYVIGDDLRHIHWRSTARTGVLMVKELVDVNLPHTTAVLDTRDASYSGDDEFELAVDAVASVAWSVARNRFPLRLLTGDGELLNVRGGPEEAEEVLDRLALVERSAAAQAPSDAARRAGSCGSLVLVSGSRAALAGAASVRRRFDQVVCVWVRDPEDDDPLAVAGATVIEVTDLEDLAAAWPL